MNINQAKKIFQKTGTLTLKVFVTDFGDGDLEELVDKINELARVDDIQFQDAVSVAELIS